MWAKFFNVSLAFPLLVIFIEHFPLKKVEAQEPPIKKLTVSELRDTLMKARGKIVLIDFWAATSMVSRQAMPFLEKLHEDYKNKGLVVMGIMVEGVREEVVKPLVKMLGVKYPIFIGGDDVIESYDIQYVPVTYLLDREGRIAMKELGFTKETPEKLRQKVEELIKAGPQP